MKPWLHNLLIAIGSAIGDSVLVYFSLNAVAPDALADVGVWKGMALFISMNVLKTLAFYLKTPPSHTLTMKIE